MKVKKQILSMILAICVALALLPASALAAELEEDGIMPVTTVDDHTPPVVTGVYMNNPGGTITVGGKLYFSVSTEDESGISMLNSDLVFTYVCE